MIFFCASISRSPVTVTFFERVFERLGECRFRVRFLLLACVLSATPTVASEVQPHGIKPQSIHPESVQPESISAKWSSAISNDDVDILQRMLNLELSGTRNSDVTQLLQQVAPNGKSVLMVASKAGELEFAKRLVELGSSVSEVTITGGTPLMFAVLGNHVRVAQWLHASGANINAKGSNGWSAATIAGAKGQSDMLRWLIRAGADMNSPDVYRFTPLMRAVDNMHALSARILLEEGDARVDFKDEAENTALHYAVAHRQSDIVRLLLKHGANPLQANRDGIRAVDLAKPYPKLAKLLEQ